jgi:hypothetical protein
MKRFRTVSCLLLLAITWPALAAEVARPIVSDIGSMLEMARARGEAHGILGGAAAEQLHKLGVDQPILVDVITLASLQQKECRRLRVVLSQKNVLMPGWKEGRDRTSKFEMNYCPGAQPPHSENDARVLP